jgi:glycosyltransferase involved in cell wall biosynthesis
MDDITILIKTFKRPAVAKRLIDSIRQFYPDIKIIVAHDDDMDYSFESCEMMVLPFDTGVSYGRNRLVDACKTEYCVILDDDCIFNNSSNLEILKNEMIRNGLDMIQPKICSPSPNPNSTQRREEDYRGTIEVANNVMMMLDRNRDGLYDFILNIFLARTEVLRQCRWNEKLKLGEHAAFFRDHKGKIKIGYTTKATIVHHHVGGKEYDEYRKRAIDFVKMDMRDSGLTKRVDIYGNCTILEE